MKHHGNRIAVFFTILGLGCAPLYASRASSRIMNDYSIGESKAALDADSFGFALSTVYNTAVISFTGLDPSSPFSLNQIRLSNSPSSATGDPAAVVQFAPTDGSAATLSIASTSCSTDGTNWTCVFPTFRLKGSNTPVYLHVISGTGTIKIQPSASPTVTIDLSNQVIAPPPVSGPPGLRFIPISPCRVVDTRGGVGISGSFGPPKLTGGVSRDFSLIAGACPLPAAAQAYALNVTVVPVGRLFFLTLWPTGQPQPVVSTLNSYNGQVVANAAIVAAGTNNSISAFASDTTDLVIDVNGYFAPATFTPTSGQSLIFHTAPPCRAVDTRNGPGTFGSPSMQGNTSRDFPLPLGSCGLPSSAMAYSVNITVVPRGRLSYLTAWPTGLAQPFVSTLNSFNGLVTSNAAIVPAGPTGGISVYVTDPTDVIIDVNGYFTLPDGTSSALLFYPVTPCRVADTRSGQGTTGVYGPPSLSGGASRDLPIPTGRCSGIPTTAQAFSLNATVVPPGPLGFLTLWPTGFAQPPVSTLNSFDGSIKANAAIVPAGTNGAVSVYASNPTDFILDISGYFAP